MGCGIANDASLRNHIPPLMRFEYLIGMRYLRSRRRERFVSLIAVISLAGVMLGTFALTVALSVMSGFEVDLRGRLLSFTPQIVVERSDGQVWNPDRRCKSKSPRYRG